MLKRNSLFSTNILITQDFSDFWTSHIDRMCVQTRPALNNQILIGYAIADKHTITHIQHPEAPKSRRFQKHIPYSHLMVFTQATIERRHPHGKLPEVWPPPLSGNYVHNYGLCDTCFHVNITVCINCSGDKLQSHSWSCLLQQLCISHSRVHAHTGTHAYTSPQHCMHTALHTHTHVLYPST